MMSMDSIADIHSLLFLTELFCTDFLYFSFATDAFKTIPFKANLSTIFN